MEKSTDIDTVSVPILSSPASPPYTLWQLTAYALKLGTIGFGGPVALVGYMHRDLVEQRKWISEAEYKEGLTLAQLMPGPLAAQLAIYLGYVHYGVGASVIGIITISAYKLTQKTIGKDWLLWSIYLISAAATLITETENIWLFLGAGALVWAIRTPPQFRRSSPVTAAAVLPFAALTPAAVETTRNELLVQIAIFFTKAGAFVFGSGLAIIPFLYGGVVKEYGWLNEREFLDAVAVAMITPGPVVITVGFIGYIVTGRGTDPWSGFLGASVAAAATFLPCYLFTIIPAPYFKKHGKRPGIVAFVAGVTAAAVGAIAGACLVLGRRTIFENGWSPDVVKIALLLTTVGLLLRFKKLQEPIIVLGAAIIGLVIYPFVHP